MDVVEHTRCPVCDGLLFSKVTPKDPLGQVANCINVNCAMWLRPFNPTEIVHGEDEG
jgi:hypothetical protein